MRLDRGPLLVAIGGIAILGGITYYAVRVAPGRLRKLQDLFWRRAEDGLATDAEAQSLERKLLAAGMTEEAGLVYKWRTRDPAFSWMRTAS